MQPTRAQTLQSRVTELTGNFDRFLNEYERRPPFQKPGQLDFHRNTISVRAQKASATDAISDDLFLRNVYQTIQAWDIGKRKSILLPYSKFKAELQSKTDKIAELDGLKIDDPQIDIQKLSIDLWQLIDSLEIVENITKLVACSKTLHHILPDLVVPIDRTYTRPFFGWHAPEFQYEQRKFLFPAINNFATIARAANPVQYVGKRWNTCRTKVIDNAIIGYMMIYPREDLKN